MEQEEKKVVSDDNLFLSSVKKSTDDRIEVIISSLTFVGPCIVIYFYSRTNQMHNNSNLFYFGTTLYMFRTVSPSVIRSLRLYIQHVIQVLWLLASKQPQNLYDIYMVYFSVQS